MHLAVAGDVFDGVILCFFSPRDVFDEILDLIESVSEDFPIFSCAEIFTCFYCFLSNLCFIVNKN